MKKNLFFLFVLIMANFVVNAAVPERKGWWKFDDAADMLKAEIGSVLVLTGTQESVNGPVAGNLATKIGVGSYLTATHGIPANGGGTLVNEYSLQIDFSVPELALWHAFVQTTVDNSDDAELFTNTDNALGAWRMGYSANLVSANTWYRMIVSVKNGETGGFYKIYINGELWVDGVGQTVDDRDALQTAMHFFADNDGEDSPINCSELGIWDVALTAEEAAELGDATTSSTGIFENTSVEKTSELGQIYPNPCASSTTVAYQVLVREDVNFQILDMTGKVVSVFSAGVKAPGQYNLELSTANLPAGTYYLRLKTDQSVSTKKLVIIQ